MQVTLKATSGPLAGREYTAEGHDSFIVGRSPAAQFRLPDTDEYFSRHHFLVEVNPPLCRVVDLESRNGTFVNGQRVSTVELKHGDEIRGGRTILKVSISDAPTVNLETVITPPGFSPGSDGLAVPASGWNVETKAGVQIPGYSILGEIGRGAMGTVYKARRESDGALVAVKLVLPAHAADPRDITRFIREGQILQELEHDHIVRCHDAGESAGQLYFVMDLIEGVDCSHLVETNGRPLPVLRAVGIIRQVCDALAHAHEAGFVHRDIKPSNILVRTEKDVDHVWVTDFGLARAYQSSNLSGLTMTGEIGGTTPFMSPDQLIDYRGVGPACDQYSTAATLYFLLTSQFVFDFPKKLSEQLLLILQGTPIPLTSRRPDSPERLSAVVQKGLSRRPEDRFESLLAFRDAVVHSILS